MEGTGLSIEVGDPIVCRGLFLWASSASPIHGVSFTVFGVGLNGAVIMFALWVNTIGESTFYTTARFYEFHGA